MSNSGFWDKMKTDWVILDTELMPWSSKAQSLLKDQYASVGAAGLNSMHQVVDSLKQTAERKLDGIDGLLKSFQERGEMLEGYVDSYRQYCWPVNSIDDYKLAPFHVLATEGGVHTDKSHEWHMEMIKVISDADSSLIVATPYKIIHLDKQDEVDSAIDWWLDLTGKGGEGMVVKPYDFISHGKKGLIQPAVKCRGREYLRIIYGAEYTETSKMQSLKSRGLGRKRSLALRELALGVESLERFVNKEPLRRVHECVFGVLALESEAVDPRL